MKQLIVGALGKIIGGLFVWYVTDFFLFRRGQKRRDQDRLEALRNAEQERESKLRLLAECYKKLTAANALTNSAQQIRMFRSAIIEIRRNQNTLEQLSGPDLISVRNLFNLIGQFELNPTPANLSHRIEEAYSLLEELRRNYSRLDL